MAKPPNRRKTTPRGRSAETGRFTTIEEAKRKKKTHVVENIPTPRRGNAKRK